LRHHRKLYVSKDKLIGYEKDIEQIETFFHHILKFKIMKYMEVSKDIFLEKIEEINDELDKTCDRFFMFVLSHGNENGILCPKVKHSEDKNDGFEVISEKEIVSHFIHERDKEPGLKSLPKCFVFQVTIKH
jgi:hypothetical protein